MLEAERAGAKALLVYMDSFERKSEAWKVLRRVQADEAHNCALIGEQLKKRGKDYSHATGEFYANAVAVQGPRARIEFLMKGLGWAVKRFDEALPRLDGDVRSLFTRMRDSHRRSIEACQAVVQKIAD